MIVPTDVIANKLNNNVFIKVEITYCCNFDLFSVISATSLNCRGPPNPTIFIDSKIILS